MPAAIVCPVVINLGRRPLCSSEQPCKVQTTANNDHANANGERPLGVAAAKKKVTKCMTSLVGSPISVVWSSKVYCMRYNTTPPVQRPFAPYSTHVNFILNFLYILISHLRKSNADIFVKQSPFCLATLTGAVPIKINKLNRDRFAIWSSQKT